MSPQEIIDLVKGQITDAVTAEQADGLHPSFTVAAEHWSAVAAFLRDDPRLGFNQLRCISGLDLHPEPQFELVYDLLALRKPAGGGLWQNGGTIAVRVRVPRENGSAPSLCHVWPAAEWHEREAYDMLGVPFTGHPDLRRILCPDDWVGWPLRKDYEFPKEYEGIPADAALAEGLPCAVCAPKARAE